MSLLERVEALWARLEMIELDGFEDGAGELAGDAGATARAMLEEIDRRRLARVLERCLAALPARLRTVLRARFYEGRTLEEVGRGLELSCERVRQLEVLALERMRETLCAVASRPAVREARAARELWRDARRRRVARVPLPPRGGALE